jgi:hypothetical protein
MKEAILAIYIAVLSTYLNSGQHRRLIARLTKGSFSLVCKDVESYRATFAAKAKPDLLCCCIK